LALEFAKDHLKPGGALLVKCFAGTGADDLRRELGALFETVLVRKPKASRDRSREFFLLGRGFKGGSGHAAQQGETV
jgi:23S rRNA (uridine2552-2'-O)-methyltransferase